MPIVLPNEGLPILCARLLNPAGASPVPWELMLFSNNLVPAQTTVYADLVESEAGGYSRITIDPAEWTVPTIVANEAVSTWGTDPIEWDITGGPWDIYGWAMVTASSPVIVMIERKAAPLLAITGPGPLTLLPRYTQGTKH